MTENFVDQPTANYQGISKLFDQGDVVRVIPGDGLLADSRGEYVGRTGRVERTTHVGKGAYSRVVFPDTFSCDLWHAYLEYVPIEQLIKDLEARNTEVKSKVEEIHSLLAQNEKLQAERDEALARLAARRAPKPKADDTKTYLKGYRRGYRDGVATAKGCGTLPA